MTAKSTRKDAIGEALKAGPMTSFDLAARTGLNKRNIDSALLLLREEGFIDFAGYTPHPNPSKRGGTRKLSLWKLMEPTNEHA